MKLSSKYKVICQAVLLGVLFLQLPGRAQENREVRLFLDVVPDTLIVHIDSTTDSLQLPHHFLIPGSEKLFRNNFRLLKGIHYRLFANSGKIKFARSLNAGDSLTAIYQKYPFPFVNEYFHRELQKVSAGDSLSQAPAGESGIVRTKILDEIDTYGSNLQRSGSIVRGFEIGNNRDLTLNSGLNLQLSGHITPDVELVAALTDESTPLQPEGNTRTLQEVDKVFVKIKSPHLGGTLGDFNLTYRNSLFGNLQRKLQGISANSQFGKYHQQITYATSRGTFYSNQFLGQEGNQGPYQLVGKNGEREIIVLAGTEKVYVNGSLLIRGENNDYIIDYSLGQITFTNQRLITSEDRIEVDFEFANNFQRYGKNLVGVSASRNSSGNGFRYDLRFLREWDDTKNLLEDSTPLTEAEKNVLEKAGDDPFQAGVSGAVFLGEGRGNYVQRDTVFAGKSQPYFHYVGTGRGDYSVRFTSVGTGQGSYYRERLGIYRFVGDGKGSYLPVRLVPLAADKKLGDLAFSYRLGNNFSISAETALSQFDRNIFSGKDDGDNQGKALMFGANYRNEKLRLFRRDLGKLDWKIKWNNREEKFSPLDRPFKPEYGYKWNLSEASMTNEEKSLESTLNYQPAAFVQVKLDGGTIEKGKSTASQRAKAQVLLTDSTIVKGEFYWEKVNSKLFSNRSEWSRLRGDLGKKIWKSLPYFNLRLENRRFREGTVKLTGFKFLEGQAGIKFFSLLGVDWNLNSGWREDYLYNPKIFNQKLKLSTSLTQRIQALIIHSGNWQGRLAFVFRKKQYESFFQKLPADSVAQFQPDPQFQDTSWNDRQSHLTNLELQYRNKNRTLDSRWNYKVASELQATLEKVFLKVEENRGNYRFDDDLQEYVPDPLGDFLLLIVPTGRFESVTNVEAGWQLRYRPQKSPKKLKGFNRVLKNISTFTYLKVDEKSREPNIWQLYFLNLKKYHNPGTTVRGTFLVNQDIYFFERNPNFGLTFRSRYRDNLFNQYVDARFNESRKIWDRSVTWRQRIWRKLLSHEVEYKQSTNFREVTAAPSRNRDVSGNSLNLKLNYRPVYAWQFLLEFESGLQKDRAELNQLSVGYLEFAPRINFALKGKARAVARFDFLKVSITDNPFNRPLPFEMGKGKKEGTSLNWNLRFEYFISGNVTVTVNYNGRRDAGFARIIHLGQAEVRAFF